MFYTFYTRTRAPTDGVISVTEPLAVTAADSGKTFSLDSAAARIDLPVRGDISAGWTITVQCTVSGRYCVVQAGDVGTGAYEHDLEPCDGISLDAIGSMTIINYNGSIYFTDPNVGYGIINPFLD